MLYTPFRMGSQGNVKKVYFEIIRIFAIGLVLFNHTQAYSVPFTHSLSGLSQVCTMCISILDKVAVPLFFMVSGALLLHKEEGLGQLFSKRILRFVCVIILFQAVQHLYALFVLDGKVTWHSFISDCIHGYSASVAAWFLYAYLAFLLFLPFLRVMVKNMRQEHFLYLFALQLLVVAFVPAPKTGLTTFLPFCCPVYPYVPVFLYVIAGYYVEHRIDIRCVRRRHLLILSACSVLSVALSVIMCQIWRCLQGETVFSQNILCFSGGLLIPCITLFLCAKKYTYKMENSWLSRVICALGGATFSIMLCENMLRRISSYLVHLVIPTGYFSDVPVVLLACIIGFPIGLLMKKIPFVRKLV